MGFYDNKVSEDMYNDDPSHDADFETPHMGIFNDSNYCHVHDMLVLGNRELLK